MTITNDTLLAQRRHVVEAHNAARGSSRKPFILNSTLTNMAQSYANEMASKNWFSHTRPNGMCYAQWWVSKAPAAWTCNSGCSGPCRRHVGENIAKGYPNAASVQTGWMNSPEHRTNILMPDFRYIGVGIADSRSNVRYWCVEFLNAL